MSDIRVADISQHSLLWEALAADADDNGILTEREYKNYYAAENSDNSSAADLDAAWINFNMRVDEDISSTRRAGRFVGNWARNSALSSLSFRNLRLPIPSDSGGAFSSMRFGSSPTILQAVKTSSARSAAIGAALLTAVSIGLHCFQTQNVKVSWSSAIVDTVLIGAEIVVGVSSSTLFHSVLPIPEPFSAGVAGGVGTLLETAAHDLSNLAIHGAFATYRWVTS